MTFKHDNSIWCTNKSTTIIGIKMLTLTKCTSTVKSIPQSRNLKLSWIDGVSGCVVEATHVFSGGRKRQFKCNLYKHFLRTMTNIQVKMIKHVRKQGTKSEKRQKQYRTEPKL